MTGLKTVENDGDVNEFIESVENPRQREDVAKIVRMMEQVSGEPPRMWGDSIIGFGRYRYKRSDGSEHGWMHTAVSPRKSNLSLYIMPGFKNYGELLGRLGKHKHSVGCLYLTRLSNVDFEVLTELVSRSVADMRAKYHA